MISWYLVSMRSGRSRAFALVLVLLVLTLLIVVLTTVAFRGVGNLSATKVTRISKQSLMAAEAGASEAMRALVEDSALDGPQSPGQLPDGARYRATIFNNFGGGVVTATNGVSVPDGTAYILAVGTDTNGGYERTVGVLVGGSTATGAGYAMGAGGDIELSGRKNISGTIRASNDIRVNGRMDITPLNGNGRLLAGNQLDAGGNTNMDSAQDARARGSISGNIRGAMVVQPNDTTPDTQPFINDGRTNNTLGPSETGRLILPNPDQAVLLAPTTFVDHTGVTSLTSTNFNLNNQIHYFPDGIDFTRVTFTGQGTIVTGNGNQLTMRQARGVVQANLIALRRPDQFPNSGNPRVEVRNSEVEGLVYAHEDVESHGSTLRGVVIAYNDRIRLSGNSTVELNSGAFSGIPGFEPWAGVVGGGGAPTSLGILSWQRG